MTSIDFQFHHLRVDECSRSREPLLHSMTSSLDTAIRAATETVLAHGIVPDRCDILQNSSTLVLRLTETLVARVVQDRDGPRQGTEWFARENAIAQHLTMRGAPVIPLHPDLPPGPHEVIVLYPGDDGEIRRRFAVELTTTERTVVFADFTTP